MTFPPDIALALGASAAILGAAAALNRSSGFPGARQKREPVPVRLEKDRRA